jgi:hypothetical protein
VQWTGLDFADERGATAGFVRLAVPAPGDGGPAWFWAYLVVPGVGLVVVRDHEVPPPRRGADEGGLEIRADGLWAELTCEVADEHWTFGLEAFGVVLDDPLHAPVDAFGGEIGERVAVGYDLEWETPRHVHGEVLVGRARFGVDGGGVLARDDEASWPPRAPTTTWCVGDGAADATPVVTVGIPMGAGRVLQRSLVRADGSVGWTTALTD